MKIGIVGWGLEGQSAYRFYGPEHSYLIANEEPRDDFPPESEKIKVQFITTKRKPGLTGNVKDLSYIDGIEQCDQIIYSVTNAKNLENKFGDNQQFWSKAKTIQHIFFEEVKTKNIIGVTGTKGKGTTATLIYEMLKTGGQTAFLGGNIGRPVLDFMDEVGPNDWVVLELSNFQLYKFPYSPHIAVCLMIAPEHLDWHPDVADYIAAKANLFSRQKADDIAIYYADNEYSTKLANYSPGHKIPYYKPPGAYVRDDGKIVISETEIIDTSEVKLLGEHNLQNICAAVTAVWQIMPDVNPIKTVLQNFSGLEHRLELVRELDSIKYYDDSFSTNPATTLVALQAIAGPKVIILGGIDKGLPFDEVAEAVAKNNVRHAIVLGELTDQIVGLLKQQNFQTITTGLKTMSDIIAESRRVAQPGDAVLLSTGSSSFDMFKDYKDRGEQFKAAVQALV